MGNFGSGRWADVANRKIPVEMCRCLSIRQLRLGGFLHDGQSGVISWVNSAGKKKGNIEFVISGDKDGKLHMTTGGQVIDIIRTPCNYGGFRHWFVCPGGCKAMKLYLPPKTEHFACRRCYDLSWLSMQENHKRDRVSKHLENADFENLSISQAMRLSGL